MSKQDVRATLSSIYSSASTNTTSREQTTRNLQGALYSMAADPVTHAARIPLVKRALAEYQAKGTNHATALKCLRAAAR